MSNEAKKPQKKVPDPPISLKKAVANLNAELAEEHKGWHVLSRELRRVLKSSLHTMKKDANAARRKANPGDKLARAPFVPPKEWVDAFRAGTSLALGLLREGRELEKSRGRDPLSDEELNQEMYAQIRAWFAHLKKEDRMAILNWASLTQRESDEGRDVH